MLFVEMKRSALKLAKRGRQMLQKDSMWIYFHFCNPSWNLDGNDLLLKVGRDWDVWQMKNNLKPDGILQAVELTVYRTNQRLSDHLLLRDVDLKSGDRIEVTISSRPVTRRCMLTDPLTGEHATWWL